MEVRVYTSPAFGGAVGQHVFAYGSDIGYGAGRGGMFGNDWGRVGYPSDFDPESTNFPYTVVQTDGNGLYNGRTEQEFIDFLRSKEAGLNSGAFAPGVNDCHNSLNRGFKRAGVDYPGSPLGRFGSFANPQASGVPFSSEAMQTPVVPDY